MIYHQALKDSHSTVIPHGEISPKLSLFQGSFQQPNSLLKDPLSFFNSSSPENQVGTLNTLHDNAWQCMLLYMSSVWQWRACHEMTDTVVSQIRNSLQEMPSVKTQAVEREGNGSQGKSACYKACQPEFDP